jgi:hypothetical protein
MSDPFAWRPPARGYEIDDRGRFIDRAAEEEEKHRRNSESILRAIGIETKEAEQAATEGDER